MRDWQYILITISLLFANVDALAQPTSPELDAIQRQTQQVLQQQQERLDAERRRIEFEQQSTTENIQSSPAVTPTSTSSLPAGCFTITRIDIQHATLLDKNTRATLTAPLLNSCVSFERINQLLRDITAFYFDQGYITTRAYLPEQDIGAGVLIVHVVEGKTTTIGFSDTRIKSAGSIYTAFPGLIGAPLNLRDIEQGLDQMNRLQSQKTRVEFLPGDNPGETRVMLDRITTSPYQFRLQYDNSGQESTGIEQMSLFAGMDTPFNINDYTYIYVQSDIEDASTEQESKNIAWHYDLPWGYWLVGIDSSQFKYQSPVEGRLQRFISSGINNSTSLFFNYLLTRDRSSKNRIKLKLQRDSTKNFIEDVKLDTSSRVLSTASLEISHQHFLPNNQEITFSATYHQGIRAWDAEKDDPNAVDVPLAQFEKYTTNTSYTKNTGIKNVPVNFSSTLRTQYSADPLFNSEKMSVGSQFSVRGYKEKSISGEKGGIWRNDVTILQILPNDLRSRYFNNLQWFVAYDIGTVSAAQHHNYESLQGWATGLRSQHKNYNLDVTYAEPVNPPNDPLIKTEQVYFSLALSF
ncbi:MAG: ShlB/FhaC/HecB family hemolysin secretion/activation protein [Gammaproteobacteria bacterium]|nr:ShlB/FhaC/HecB family hemolysin secretion/activation protein [Gammaproteobacteria bacterium]